jgi:hypothetical protein
MAHGLGEGQVRSERPTPGAPASTLQAAFRRRCPQRAQRFNGTNSRTVASIFCKV